MGEELQRLADEADRLEALINIYDQINEKINVQPKDVDKANDAMHLLCVIEESAEKLALDVDSVIRRYNFEKNCESNK